MVNYSFYKSILLIDKPRLPREFLAWEIGALFGFGMALPETLGKQEKIM